MAKSEGGEKRNCDPSANEMETRNACGPLGWAKKRDEAYLIVTSGLEKRGKRQFFIYGATAEGEGRLFPIRRRGEGERGDALHIGISFQGHKKEEGGKDLSQQTE